MNRVSVILPTYNSCESLRQSIISALEQSTAAHEVIVINDGSTDDTKALVRSFGDQVVYLSQENQGQGAARNAGLKIATGDFVAFLDADDYWLPGFLEACLKFMQTHPHAVAVSTGWMIRKLGKPDQIWPASPSQFGDDTPRMIDDFFAFWASHDHVRTGSTMIRRDTIETAGHQRADLRISQDLEYWAYLATFGPWGLIPTPLWVGCPQSAVVQRTWLDKYRTRRRLCPTVEEWERRILPRLREADWPAFRLIRGRVAAGYAQSKILGGDFAAGRAMVRKYGAEMPRSWFRKMVLAADRAGSIGWGLGCQAVRWREYLKSQLVRWRQPRPERQPVAERE